jgi:hypothetical protein
MTIRDDDGRPRWESQMAQVHIVLKAVYGGEEIEEIFEAKRDAMEKAAGSMTRRLLSMSVTPRSTPTPSSSSTADGGSEPG